MPSDEGDETTRNLEVAEPLKGRRSKQDKRTCFQDFFLHAKVCPSGS